MEPGRNFWKADYPEITRRHEPPYEEFRKVQPLTNGTVMSLCVVAIMFPIMKLGNAVLLGLFCLVRFSNAQPLTASVQYTLHAEEQAHTETVAAIAPDQSLITIAGKKEGDWTLTRLIGWSTPSPTEETLQIKGFPPGRVSGWGDSTGADLVVSPDGRYAIARLETSAPGMLSEFRKNTEAIVTVNRFSRQRGADEASDSLFIG
jgi:hypothetical protein